MEFLRSLKTFVGIAVFLFLVASCGAETSGSGNPEQDCEDTGGRVAGPINGRMSCIVDGAKVAEWWE